MQQQNYTVQNETVGHLINWIDEGTIGLPEMQRPFVWPSTKVRDLIDSLYKGFPIGFIITWTNPELRLKDGSLAETKKIIIDGQQRITALTAALTGQEVLDAKYRKHRIKIAFCPAKETFETQNATNRKDPTWIPDIATLFASDFSSYSFVPKFAAMNGYDADVIARPIEKLRQLSNNPVGNIELSSTLDIDQVTEIFKRINAQGKALSSADFIMSKLSSDNAHNGSALRKTIDYFSHLLAQPQDLKNIELVDSEFTRTKYFHSIRWVASEQTKMYCPHFGDIFHVILNFAFGRGRHADLIALVSGRDFQTRTYTEAALDRTYAILDDAVLSFVNESHFKRYLMILKSMGMLNEDSTLLNGTGILNFGYAFYLYLVSQNERDGNQRSQSQIESLVRRWIALSALTARYSGSSETQSEQDIRGIMAQGAEEYLKQTEGQLINDDFWRVTVTERLKTATVSSNLWSLFLMNQVKNKALGWLERDHRVESLISEQGNIHHIFPRAYLAKFGVKSTEYNRIANYVFLTQPRNLQIKDMAPKDYLADMRIKEFASPDNFSENAIPKSLIDYDYMDYSTFVSERSQLMANCLRTYYEGL